LKSANSVGVEGARALSVMLKVNTALTSLILSCNKANIGIVMRKTFFFVCVCEQQMTSRQREQKKYVNRFHPTRL